MKSPFPGMDPYVEARGTWKDFHDDVIPEIIRAIRAVLPRRYIARPSSRSYIALTGADEKDERHFEPDVRVTAPRETGRIQATAGVATVAEAANGESYYLRAFIEEDFDERFIDIYELEPERRLVTSIELLSPSNKRRGTPGWKRYLRKRQALLLGKANLVEIDLLRGGDRMPMLDPLPESPYYLLVARQEKAPSCRVWPAFFDRPLPPIPIPLLKPDPDIPLALQPLIEAIYEQGRYGEEIDYARPLDPPLTAQQTAWLRKRLRPVPTEPPAARPRRPRRR